MIIGLSGRKQAGKSTLSKVLIDRGFQKVSFATYLKQVCSELYSFPLEWCYDSGEKEKVRDPGYTWDETTNQALSDIVGEGIVYNQDPKNLTSVRQIMQYIGTEVLRRHDADFHVKRTMTTLVEGKDYVFDDVRLLNEKEAITRAGGRLVFILRPNYRDYDNHSSEITLNWTMFDHIIVNDSDLGRTIKKFETFLDNLRSSPKPSTRKVDVDRMMTLLRENNWDTMKVSGIMGVSRDAILWWRNRLLCGWRLSSRYQVNKEFLLHPTEENAYCAGLLTSDGCLKKSGKSQVRFAIYIGGRESHLPESIKRFSGSDKPVYHSLKSSTWTNGGKRDVYEFLLMDPFVVENLKLWNVDERKSTAGRRVPDMVKTHPELFGPWWTGVVDGDGSVLLADGKYPTIYLLSSPEVANFVFARASQDGIDCSLHSHKDRADLSEVRYSGQFAQRAYQLYYSQYGLPRKWDIMKNSEWISKRQRDYGEGVGGRK